MFLFHSRFNSPGFCSVLLRLWLLLILVRAGHGEEPVSAIQSDLKLRFNTDTIGRYVADRWSSTTATVSNPGDETRTALVVVTPPATGGLQYAKRFMVPGRANVEATWPVRVGKANKTTSDFEYMIFPDGAEDGLIRRRADEEFIPSYSAIVEPNSSSGMTGILHEADEPADQLDLTFQMVRVMSYLQRQVQSVASLRLAALSSHGECLEPYDQLTLTSSELLSHPDAVNCIQAWLQRGGRLWIRLDRTGIDAARLILSDALSMSLIGECTTNSVMLTLNPEYSREMFPIREVERTFEEPIRYLRVVADGGEAIWNMDGWPAALRVPVGRGTVFVTTVDASVFLLPHTPKRQDAPAFQLIPSAEFTIGQLFERRPEPVLLQDMVSEQAANEIGFRIPSRYTAIGLTLCFPALLLASGVWLQRRGHGERLVLFLPFLAVLFAVPAIGTGILGRRVAPKTVIETAFIQSVPGLKRLVSDGYASVFDFGSEELRVSGSGGTIVEEETDPTNRNYRRLVWTESETCHWEGLEQPNGIQTFSVRSLEYLDRPLSANVTFDANGVVGKLGGGGLQAAGNLIIAGMNPDRMSLRLDAGGIQFSGTPEDVLAVGDFSGTSLVSDEQRRRAEVYASIFDMEERSEPFPNAPSLLFWAEADRQAVNLSDPNIRHRRSLLVVQPLRMEQPPVETRITIPSPFIRLRTLPDANGAGVSGVFNNAKRRWLSAEAGSRSFMEFQIPDVCLPFEVDTADIELFLRAGSRTVTVSAGSFETQEVVRLLESPLGAHSIQIPADLIRDSCRHGKLYLSLTVSDLQKSLQPANASQTQNDYWEISRMGLTLTGKRTVEVP